MGAYYKAQTIFGVKIPRNKMFKEKTLRVRSCIGRDLTQHIKNCPDENKIKGFNFCPECGNNPWTKKTVETALLEEFDPENKHGDIGELKIKGWDVITDTANENFYVGFLPKETPMSWDGTKSGVMTEVPDDIGNIRRQLRDDLEEVGLWNNSKFGLWTILYCSY